MSVIVKQPEQNPIPAEVLATAIVEIAVAMRAINNTRLTRKALVTLISAQSGIGKKDVDIVLNNLADLEHDWLKPKAGAK